MHKAQHHVVLGTSAELPEVQNHLMVRLARSARQSFGTFTLNAPTAGTREGSRELTARVASARTGASPNCLVSPRMRRCRQAYLSPGSIRSVHTDR